MDFEEKLRERIEISAPRSAERNMMKFVLGEVQQKKSPVSMEQGFAIVRTILEGVNKNLLYLKPEDPRRILYNGEVEILESLLPNYLTLEQIRSRVDEKMEAEIKSMKKDGPATGLLMANIKKDSLYARGEDVETVVKSIRG